MMNDQDLDYSVDGMHEALISELSKIGALRVISRTSAMRYKQTDKTASQIARELDVDALVEGSVLLAADRVRITAQLIGIAPERHLWSDDYERNMGDILAFHSDVARAVAEQIKVAVTPDEEARLTTARQVNPEAYQLYLKAWHFREQQTRESVPVTLELLEQAVAIDAAFAQGWAALVWAHYMMWDTRLWPLETARPKARHAAERAVALDDQLADAHLFQGLYRYMFEWDFDGAEASFQRAIELTPGNLEAHYEFGLFLARMGRLDEGMGHLQHCLTLAPFSERILGEIAVAYQRGGRPEEALAAYHRMAELFPDEDFRFGVAWNHLWAGNYDAALELFIELEEEFYVMVTRMMRDRSPQAKAYLDSVEAVLVREKPLYWKLRQGTIRIARWDYELVLDQLEAEFQWGDPGYVYLKVSPEYKPFRDHPRFQALIKKVWGEEE